MENILPNLFEFVPMLFALLLILVFYGTMGVGYFFLAKRIGFSTGICVLFAFLPLVPLGMFALPFLLAFIPVQKSEAPPVVPTIDVQ